MREDDEVAADIAVGMDRERDRHLLNDALLAQKGLASFGDDAGERPPNDQSEGQIRQVVGGVDPEQAPINKTHGGDHHQGTYSQPERPQNRAAIAQLDVLQRQRGPHPAPSGTVDQIAPCKGGSAGQRRPFRRTVRLHLGNRHGHHSGRLPRLSIRTRRRPFGAIQLAGSRTTSTIACACPMPNSQHPARRGGIASPLAVCPVAPPAPAGRGEAGPSSAAGT